MTKVFSPTRLQIARARRRLNKKELAAACGVSPQAVAGWENGHFAPSESAVEAIAVTLQFKEDFFYRPELDIISPEAASFRARSRLSARERHAALATGTMAQEMADWIGERFNLPATNLTELRGEDPDIAAEIVRAEWGLGDRPIKNLIRLLESKGVLVFSLAQDCADLDAFSFWSGGRPIILLNTMKSPDRSRFDAAHELAHLLLHRGTTSRSEEIEADRFAGAFLLPKSDVLSNCPRPSGLRPLIKAKHRWGVSLKALVYQLHALGVLSAWRYRTFLIEIMKRGYHLDEPKPAEREKSIILSKVFDMLSKQGVRLPHIADQLAWNQEHVTELVFGLGATWVSLTGGGQGGAAIKTRAVLREV